MATDATQGGNVTQYGWANIPERIRRQVWNLVEALDQLLNKDLVGVYLYGSLAMGCFNPRTSDLDFLVVMRREMTIETKKRLAEMLLHLSHTPVPMEASFLTAESLTHWRHPAPYDFHFSEDYRAKYDHALRAGEVKQWRSPQGEDPDLAANITVARERWIVLHGLPVHSTLPPVPERDFLAALLTDSAWARERIDQEPVYAVLNQCRTLGYQREKLILSKAEGAKWRSVSSASNTMTSSPKPWQRMARMARWAASTERNCADFSTMRKVKWKSAPTGVT